MAQIDIHPSFIGVPGRDTAEVTVTGTIYSPERTCSDLEVTLGCPTSNSASRAVIERFTGNWTAKLTTRCNCGTSLVSVVASSAALGISSTSVGPIVCYVDWHKRSLAERLVGHPWIAMHHRLLAPSNLGTCYKCVLISVILAALSVLALSAGVITNLLPVTVIGLLATLAFGSLAGLHIVFFLLKRKKVASEPLPLRRSCCGG